MCASSAAGEPRAPLSAANGRLPHATLQSALHALAASRLRTRFAVATGTLSSLATAPLLPSELAAFAAAHPSRLAAFRGGRAVAREALAVLGQPAVAIPVGASGAPVWPAGFVGSISHTAAVAAAIVVASPPLAGIGLDVEHDTPLEDATMVRLVCRPDELLAGRPADDVESRRRGKLVFVLKEAIYKLYSPLFGAFLDFQDVTVVVDEAAGRFRATVAPTAEGKARPTLGGVFARVDGFYAALALPELE